MNFFRFVFLPQKITQVFASLQQKFIPENYQRTGPTCLNCSSYDQLLGAAAQIDPSSMSNIFRSFLKINA